MNILRRTNWNKYYQKKSKFSNLTQKITKNVLMNYVEQYCGLNNINKVIELGGANSCFFDDFVKKFRIKNYTIVDNSSVGIDKFLSSTRSRKIKKNAIFCDLLKEELKTNGFDLCYSVGLIEHFNRKGTKKIIKEHFRCVKENGIVIISFPTPTIQYKIVRTFMEFMGVWKFPDERPLTLKEVLPIIQEHGEVLKLYLNRKLPLTQQICVIRKHK